MNRNKPTLYERQLLEQEELILKVDLADENSDAFKQFHFNHRQLHAIFSDSRDPTVIEILTLSYLKNLEYRLLFSDNPQNETYLINQSIDYIARKKRVRSLITDPTNQKILTHAVLTCVRYASEGRSHWKRYHVGEILQQWLDIKVPRKTIDSLKATVDLMYGPAVWLLCRDDVNSERELPKYLAESGFAIVNHQHEENSGVDIAAVNDWFS